jgi:tetratricopeptide (TPR) repeat protein
MQKIGLILQRGRKYESAYYNFAKSYEILKANFNYECPNVVGSLINLANCLLDLRRFDEALSNYKRVLRMFERNDSMAPNIENVMFLFNMSFAAEHCRFF